MRFRVLIDGQPPGAAHGTDVDGQGNGILTGQRLHQLIRQPGRITGRTFEITFLDPAVQSLRVDLRLVIGGLEFLGHHASHLAYQFGGLGAIAWLGCAVCWGDGRYQVAGPRDGADGPAQRVRRARPADRGCPGR